MIWNSTTSRFQLITGSALLAILLAIMPFFFNTIEKRKGIQLDDIVLDHIPAHNVSVLIFAIIWGMGALALYRAAKQPAMYVTYVWAYSFITIVRFLTISLVKLDPPAGLIQLIDPLTGIFYGHAQITKDLFFSGHTATLCLIYLTIEKKVDKTIGFLAIIIVGCLLLVQHVHYTLDVLVAPVATFGIYKLVVWMLGNKDRA
ncbi:phosphatase PAP2-related protein [Mucilaginibacter boryungensis]